PRATADIQPAAPSVERLDDLCGLLLRRGQPQLRGAVESFPGYSQLLGVQGEVLGRVVAALGVQPAQAKHTDGEGVLTLQSLQPGAAAILLRSYRAPAAAATAGLPAPPALRTMTQSFAHYGMPDGSVRIYSKTSISPPVFWPTPQLDIEIGGTEQSLILYAALAPRSALSTDLPYLHRYYDQPPPAVQQQQDGGHTGSSNNNSNGGSGSGSGSDLPSFKQLEAEARKEEGFTPFVSPSLWVRAMAVGALCFTVPWQGGRDAGVMEAVRRYSTTLTDIWLAHLLADARTYAGSDEPASDGGPDPSGQRARWRQAAEVLRNHVRHDPMTSLLYPVYGEPQVVKLIETVAGDLA
ncbi:hypothetical protein TSOC_005820, partial [Tetrabaena socialis]